MLQSADLYHKIIVEVRDTHLPEVLEQAQLSTTHLISNLYRFTLRSLVFCTIFPTLLNILHVSQNIVNKFLKNC